MDVTKRRPWAHWSGLPLANDTDRSVDVNGREVAGVTSQGALSVLGVRPAVDRSARIDHAPALPSLPYLHTARMVHIDDPLNRERLAELLDRDGFNKDRYSLYGAHSSDAVVIDNRPGGWVVFYSERGGEELLRSHDTEDSACRDLLERLRRYAHPQ